MLTIFGHNIWNNFGTTTCLYTTSELSKREYIRTNLNHETWRNSSVLPWNPTLNVANYSIIAQNAENHLETAWQLQTNWRKSVFTHQNSWRVTTRGIHWTHQLLGYGLGLYFGKTLFCRSPKVELNWNWKVTSSFSDVIWAKKPPQFSREFAAQKSEVSRHQTEKSDWQQSRNKCRPSQDSLPSALLKNAFLTS